MKPKLVWTDTRSPQDSLSYLVPQLADAERLVRDLRAEMAREGRRLARIRGVAFIRDEHLRREFGG